MNDKELNKRIGNRLKELREEKRRADKIWSRQYVVNHLPKRIQKDGSEKSISPQAYEKIENGHVMPTSQDAAALAELFGVSVSYIWCETDYRTTVEADRATLEGRFRKSLSTEAKQFLKSLGIPLPGVKAIPKYIDRETGEELTYLEAIQHYPVTTDSKNGWSAVTDVEPDGTKIRKEMDSCSYSVSIGRKTYHIQADQFEAMMRIVMESARSSFEIACRRLAESK